MFKDLKFSFCVFVLGFNLSFAQVFCYEAKDFYVGIESACVRGVCEALMQKVDKKSRQSLVLKGERRFDSFKFKQGMKELIIRHNELLELDYNKLVKSHDLSPCK